MIEQKPEILYHKFLKYRVLNTVIRNDNKNNNLILDYLKYLKLSISIKAIYLTRTYFYCSNKLCS